jgi:hypothetical protein
MNEIANPNNWYSEVHQFITTSREELKKQLETPKFENASNTAQISEQTDQEEQEATSRVLVLEEDELTEVTEPGNQTMPLVYEEIPSFELYWTSSPYQISNSLAGKESYSNIFLSPYSIEISGSVLLADLKEFQIFLDATWSQHINPTQQKELQDRDQELTLSIWLPSDEDFQEKTSKLAQRKFEKQDLQNLLNQGMLDLRISTKEIKKNNIKIGSYLNFLLQSSNHVGRIAVPGEFGGSKSSCRTHI